MELEESVLTHAYANGVVLCAVRCHLKVMLSCENLDLRNVITRTEELLAA